MSSRPDGDVRACAIVPHARHSGAVPTPDRMFLHGIAVHGRHGVLDVERREGQCFVIDVEWWLDTTAAASTDHLRDTVCYTQLHDCVRDVVAGQPWSLIETLADRLASSLFDQFAQIARVELTVHKPDAPIGGTFADVGITIARHR